MWCGAPVAVKQPIAARATDHDLRRFVGEVAALSTLRHPNVVQFLGAVWQPGLMLVLEWMEGGSVRDALAAGRPVDARRVATEVARAMRHVHGLHMCHRDLKAAVA